MARLALFKRGSLELRTTESVGTKLASVALRFALDWRWRLHKIDLPFLLFSKPNRFLRCCQMISNVFTSNRVSWRKSQYRFKQQRSRCFCLEIVCLVTWITKKHAFSNLFTKSGAPLRVQYTIVLQRNLFCCKYFTASSVVQCLRSLNPCFVIVLLTVLCQSTRSCRFLRIPQFSTKNLTPFKVILSSSSNSGPELLYYVLTILSCVRMWLLSLHEKELTPLIFNLKTCYS